MDANWNCVMCALTRSLFRQHVPPLIVSHSRHKTDLVSLILYIFADLQSIRKLLGNSDAEETTGSGLNCPSCERPFDKGKKRKLIDTCGHERCYSCMFKNEKCPICCAPAAAAAAVSKGSDICKSVRIARGVQLTLTKVSHLFADKSSTNVNDSQLYAGSRNGPSRFGSVSQLLQVSRLYCISNVSLKPTFAACPLTDGAVLNGLAYQMVWWWWSDQMMIWQPPRFSV